MPPAKSQMTAHLSAFQDAFRTGAPISVINYHNTPAYRVGQYDRELTQVARLFAPTTEDDLAAYLTRGIWPHAKPGVIIALYNGYRNNYDVFRPLLEKYGLIGWFFATSGYVGCPAAQQLAFGREHNLKTIADEYPDGRYAMSWEELRAMDGRQVIASHTRNHAQITVADEAAMRSEIMGSQEDFCAHLGHPVRAFAWLFGSAYGETPLADRHIDRAGYEFLFSNFMVQRLKPGSGPYDSAPSSSADKNEQNIAI